MRRRSCTHDVRKIKTFITREKYLKIYPRYAYSITLFEAFVKVFFEFLILFNVILYILIQIFYKYFTPARHLSIIIVEAATCRPLVSLPAEVAKRRESVRKQHGALFSLERDRAAARRWTACGGRSCGCSHQQNQACTFAFSLSRSATAPSRREPLFIGRALLAPTDEGFFEIQNYSR